MDPFIAYMVRQKQLFCIALSMDALTLSVFDAGMQACNRRALCSKGNSVGSSWSGALQDVYKQT